MLRSAILRRSPLWLLLLMPERFLWESAPQHSLTALTPRQPIIRTQAAPLEFGDASPFMGVLRRSQHMSRIVDDSDGDCDAVLGSSYGDAAGAGCEPRHLDPMRKTTASLPENAVPEVAAL